MDKNYDTLPVAESEEDELSGFRVFTGVYVTAIIVIALIAIMAVLLTINAFGWLPEPFKSFFPTIMQMPPRN